MKTTNYRLQTEIEHLTPTSQKDWFKNYVREILESDKPYHVKADYIGLSFQELQNKIDYLSSDIKELQLLKKTLTEAKTIAQEATASVLTEYGIDRIDGTAISSLTHHTIQNQNKRQTCYHRSTCTHGIGVYKNYS